MLEFTLSVTNPYIKMFVCVYIYTYIFFPIRWKIYIGIIFFFHFSFTVTPKGEIFVEINIFKTCLLGYFKKIIEK